VQAAIPTRLKAGLAAIGVALLLNAAVTYINVGEIRQADNWVTHTLEVRQALDELLGAIVTAEASERGFALTGKQSYVDQYDYAATEARSRVKALRELTADNAEQQHRLQRAQAEIERKFEFMDRVIATQRGGGVAASQRLIQRGEGAAIMAAVRGAIGELDREENRLLALRNADATRSAAAAVAGLAVFTLGILVLAVAVFYFIRREIAVREQTIAQQRITEQRLHLQANAIGSSVNGILIADAAKPDHPLVYVNPAFEKTSGYSAAEVLGRNCRFLQGTDTDQPGLEEVRIALREGRETEVVLRNYRKDGNLFWNQLKISPVRNEAGEVTQFVGIQNDITGLKAYEAELERNANYDSLTGLPNRNLFADRVQRAVIGAARSGKLVGILWMNLERFRRVNESFGRAAGDRVLKAFGERLARSVWENDTVARMGGDKFAVVLREIASPNDAARVVARIQETLAKPFSILGQEIFLGANVGIALYPADSESAESVVANAEIAMLRTREEGGHFRYYTAKMNSAAAERLELEAALRRALERDELRLFYQPRVDLRTGRIGGVEALIRWQHPSLGMVSPVNFIPIAEETGLIIPIGQWVFETACAQSRRWRESGHANLRMAVNLSPRQFRQSDLVANVSRALERTGVAAEALELEVTESVAMDNPARSAEILRNLKALGISLAIDDFGTGHSSLGYLNRFPLDFLKVDQSFVRGIPGDADSAVIVRTVIALARNLRLETIAEGVETEAQLRFLQQEGCEEAQGYLFSRPQPAADLAAVLGAGFGKLVVAA
jgi:diguanylate cyclase (GGDEF)-like protein/PAS domain S-box-containing protein